MNLNITDFLDFATYKGTLDGICITDYPPIINELKDYTLNNIHHRWYYVEWNPGNTNYYLWTYNGWINECKRRAKLNKLLLYKPTTEVKAQTKELSLAEAVASGDEKEMLKAIMRKKGIIQ